MPRVAVLMRFSVGVLVCCLCAAAGAATTDDLVFIHHSCGRNWLNFDLHNALLAKDYIDERNDIYYGTSIAPDPGRPVSLTATPGDHTNMNHWVRWFNDYLGGARAYDCSDGFNRIIMFKSCYPASYVVEGSEPGDALTSTRTIPNYKAVYRHPSGPGNVYTWTFGGGPHDYHPLEDIFAANPDVLFIAVTAPPLCYTCTDDTRGHCARVFNGWLKGEWLDSYNARHPLMKNVAVFDWFEILANPDDHPTYPNRLKAEYGGDTSDSHPNVTANLESTAIFATNPDNFIDAVWETFIRRLPGDADLDGDVDFADYVTAKGNFGTAGGATYAEGDTDGDGDVDFVDYVTTKAAFGTSVAGAAAPVPPSVPEPTTALSLLLCLSFLRRRKGR